LLGSGWFGGYSRRTVPIPAIFNLKGSKYSTRILGIVTSNRGCSNTIPSKSYAA